MSISFIRARWWPALLALGLAAAVPAAAAAPPAPRWQSGEEGVYRFFPPGVDPNGYTATAAFLPHCIKVSFGEGGSANIGPYHEVGERDCNMTDWVDGLGPCPARETPVFSSFNEQEIVTLPIAQGTSLYGLGEAGGRLLRNGTVVECWNTDDYGYPTGASPLYQSHPWLLAVRADGSAFGFLYDSSARCRFDLTDGIRVTADGPPAAVVTIERDSPRAVLQELRRWIGSAPVPPLWALGYHQSRFSYTPDNCVREIAAEFRRRHIPCDALWLDIDYMDGHRGFTFDPRAFPDPQRLNKDLHAAGFHTVWILDPGVKREPGYSIYDSGSADDRWVKLPDGSPAVGRVWPGECVFPDFLSEATRDWWARLCRALLDRDLDGFWVDMNEPSVFDLPGKTLPPAARHAADDDLGGPGPHSQYHNIYGMQMARATSRAFFGSMRTGIVVSRSGFLGSQRYAAAWTGDNTADWAHLAESVPMVLNLGLSGQPFAGADIGGYKGMGDGALFARWMGLGAFLPLARGHSERENGPKEPWAFGAEVEAACRIALEARYRLLPYLHGLFMQASQTGLPVARPLFFAEPANPALRAEDRVFLLGDALLVDPQLTPAGGDALPSLSDVWREFEPVPGWAERAKRGELPRLWLRGGAMIPLGPIKEWVEQDVGEEVEWLISLDRSGKAGGVIYFDACGDGSLSPARAGARLDGGLVRVKLEGGACGRGGPCRFRLLAGPNEERGARVILE